MSALASADPEAVIYASAPLTPHSEAMLCVEAESTAGLDYLLGVALAREVLHVGELAAGQASHR
jgi:hypothetical protein